jgi:DNA-binding GntR family transcriptional regulator
MRGADVYEALTARILRGEMLPGERVNIDALAHEFVVSQTPVREALARLESDGLVTKELHKGYRTTPKLTAAELGNLYELRLLIEPNAARKAAHRSTAEEIDALRDEIGLFLTAPSGPGHESYKDFSQHDARLHRLVLQMAGNPVITAAVERTHFHLHAFRLQYDARAGRETVDEHRAIVEAIAAREGAAAEAAMRHHLQEARARLLTGAF